MSKIKKPEDITADSLTLFTIMEPPIGLYVISVLCLKIFYA